MRNINSEVEYAQEKGDSDSWMFGRDFTEYAMTS